MSVTGQLGISLTQMAQAMMENSTHRETAREAAKSNPKLKEFALKLAREVGDLSNPKADDLILKATQEASPEVNRQLRDLARQLAIAA